MRQLRRGINTVKKELFYHRAVPPLRWRGAGGEVTSKILLRLFCGKKSPKKPPENNHIQFSGSALLSFGSSVTSVFVFQFKKKQQSYRKRRAVKGGICAEGASFSGCFSFALSFSAKKKGHKTNLTPLLVFFTNKRIQKN